MTYTPVELNEYVVVSDTGETTTVISPDLLGAVQTYDSANSPLVLAKLAAKAVSVLVQNPDVAFTSRAVLTDGTEAAGCKTYPEAFTIGAGDSIVLSAVPAAGYTFTSWSRNGAVLSAEAVAKVTVTPLAEGETAAVYKALFARVI